MEPTIEESELSHSNTKKSEISIGNERKVSKLSFGGDDVRFYEKVCKKSVLKLFKNLQKFFVIFLIVDLGSNRKARIKNIIQSCGRSPRI